MALKKIEAYVTSDGKKFFEKPKAKNHEEWLKYQAKKDEIKDYLLNLLGITPNPDDEIEEEDWELREKVLDQCRSRLSEDTEMDDIVEIIIDMITIADGAMLKTAEYAKGILS